MTERSEFPEQPETTPEITDEAPAQAANDNPVTQAPESNGAPVEQHANQQQNDQHAQDDEPMDDMNDYSERLERLGGEPAPVITPEEFARLQKAGQVHIDARGRVRTTRRSDAEAGVSLRKRRAWYA